MAGPTLLAEFQRRVQSLARSSGDEPRGLLSLTEEAKEVLHSWDAPALRIRSPVDHRLLADVVDAGIPQLLLDAAQVPHVYALVRLFPPLSSPPLP